MPYQTLPGLIVCGGAFCFIGLGMQASQWLFLDRVRYLLLFLFLFISFFYLFLYLIVFL